jgi:formylglycine-generating enzyme required for sulfatase activity
LTRAVTICDRRGERTGTLGERPLRLGGGEQADVLLPGIEPDEVVAIIACSDDHPFLQPVGHPRIVFHNDKPVAKSQWLNNGDSVRVGNTVVTCELDANRFCLRTQDASTDLAVRPPDGAPPHGVPAPMPQHAARTPARHPGSRSPVIYGIVSMAFLGLAAIAGFIFMATPVSITIVPPPERITISGGLPSFKVGGRRLMYPGRYRLHADKDGYQALESELDIRSGNHQAISFQMDKLPGLVSIRSRPVDGATVVMDGKDLLGRTPIAALEIEAGVHQLRIEARRYLPVESTLAVEGLGKEQTFEVELTPGWAAVSVRSSPAGAGVWIDGVERGATPVTLDLLAGPHNVEIRHAEHETATQEVLVVPNQPQQLPEIKLQPSPGTLALVSTPTGANVTVDDQFRGTTPVELALSPLSAHRLALSKSGYESFTGDITVQPGKTLAKTIELRPKFGTVFITVQPADAELFVDGRSYGAATRRLDLTAVAHRLEIKRAGYETYRTTVTPRTGLSQALSVTLEPTSANPAPGPARKRSREQITTSDGQTLQFMEPGSFVMGASRREQGRRSNENLRRVELTRAFYLGRNEVTNAQFRRFRPAHVSGGIQGYNLNADQQPVVGISWNDAAEYLNWLSAKDSLPLAYERNGDAMVPMQPPNTGYRLPSEAEWAYAARFRNQVPPLRYPWGKLFPPTTAAGNYADTTASGILANTLPDYTDGFAVTAPVGKFSPNALGIHDLGGNVAEWCQDFYGVYPNSADVPTRDPLGPASGQHHVVRGSSWRHASISELRLSYRDYSSAVRPDLGFRIARYAH